MILKIGYTAAGNAVQRKKRQVFTKEKT
jgi:hypothetical protein